MICSNGYKYLPTKLGCEELGICSRTLYRHIAAKRFSRGVHYYKKGVGRSSGFMLNVEAIRKTMATWAYSTPKAGSLKIRTGKSTKTTGVEE
jgi:hypothetical protein